MIDLTPSELSIAGILLPPALVAGLVGFIAAAVVARLLNRTRLSRHFWFSPLAFLSMWGVFGALANFCLLAL